MIILNFFLISNDIDDLNVYWIRIFIKYVLSRVGWLELKMLCNWEIFNYIYMKWISIYISCMLLLFEMFIVWYLN